MWNDDKGDGHCCFVFIGSRNEFSMTGSPGQVGWIVLDQLLSMAGHCLVNFRGQTVERGSAAGGGC